VNSSGEGSIGAGRCSLSALYPTLLLGTGKLIRKRMADKKRITPSAQPLVMIYTIKRGIQDKCLGLIK
jgi:hypothetical protein